MTTFNVAVYGSLLSGLSNNHILGDSIYKGTFNTKEEYSMYSLGGFPAIVEGGHTSIKCEVYEVSTSTLLSLDRLEGYDQQHPSRCFYNRKEIDTSFGKAYIYLLDSMNNKEEVEDGDWRKYYEKRGSFLY
jgi:gamma-glutamylcyclotransferase (GGCT)/AIG2-like uncharacterized protein YtfP